jgi:PHD/YefM family antitoxin component YafN of YafNO toxin-antitoxin module
MSPTRDSIKLNTNFVQGTNGMLNINRDINSLSNFKRNTPEFLRQLKTTRQPVVLTINGNSELVVQDTGSYQKLLEVAERVQELESLQQAVDEMKAGKGTPIEEMFDEMRQILALKKSR